MILLVFMSLAYASWIVFLLRGWHTIPVTPVTTALPTQGISIVVAFRNEAHRLNRLLSVLSKQDYPTSLLEVILVNDHSEDLYESTLESFSSFPFILRMLSLKEGKF